MLEHCSGERENSRNNREHAATLKPQAVLETLTLPLLHAPLATIYILVTTSNTYLTLICRTILTLQVPPQASGTIMVWYAASSFEFVT